MHEDERDGGEGEAGDVQGNEGDRSQSVTGEVEEHEEGRPEGKAANLEKNNANVANTVDKPAQGSRTASPHNACDPNAKRHVEPNSLVVTCSQWTLNNQQYIDKVEDIIHWDILPTCVSRADVHTFRERMIRARRMRTADERNFWTKADPTLHACIWPEA